MKLTLLTGLPGSGKSTKAEELVKQSPDAIRVNKDSLRNMLYFLPKNWGPGGKNFRSHMESLVFGVEQVIAEYFLNEGFDVIVDDTNLSPRYITPFHDIAEKLGAEFEIITLDADVETCIERDKNRNESVGEKVIRQLDQVRSRQSENNSKHRRNE